MSELEDVLSHTAALEAEIERLQDLRSKERAQIKRLRAVLIELDKFMDFDTPAPPCNCFRDPSGLNAAMHSARRSLDGEKG